MKFIYISSITIWIFFLFFCEFLSAQVQLPDRLLEINKINISGNRFFDDAQILESFATKETPGAISKFLYNLFGDKFGKPNEYFYEDIFISDLERLKQLYSDNGFFDVNIISDFHISKDTTKLDIYLNIIESNRATIDTVIYAGLENCKDISVQEISAKSLIKKGSYYQKSLVNEEANRVIDLISNKGYPFITIITDSSRAERYYSTNTFKIKYFFNPGQKYKFGDVTILVEPQRPDIVPSIIEKYLEFRKGEIVSKSKIITSEKNLNRLGLFESARIDIKENFYYDSTGVMPVIINLRPKNRHELAPEIIFSDEDNTFNFGVGLGYTNRNFLGNARNFTSRIRLNTQSIMDWNFKRVFSSTGLNDETVQGIAELNLQIIQPYFFTKSLNGSWTLSLLADKKNFYLVTLIRNKIGLVNQFATYTTGYFEWTLERSNVNWLEDTIKTGLSLLRLRQEQQPQFNSIFSFTLQRDKTNDIFSPTEGFFHAASIEESGLMQSVFKNLQPTIPYTQFYKITLFGRWYKDLTKRKFNIFALKLKAGYQDKYGESKLNPDKSIPLSRRFFAGGSGSIRAWKTRTLGAIPQHEIQLGGNFIFEGNVELRVNHLRGFGKLWFLNLENFWTVYFFDFGNVWNSLSDVKFTDIALASGLGIRYDTFVGPIRLDFAFRIYDPMEVYGKRWITDKKFFKETLYNGVLNFGIGHAF
ncbi:MAG: hypothetical protein IGBAC_0653 [Ignavibacteriae bacterium]|nr:MAG: hypothetical protein IGBAC_0653 [Ignavibacteriota bacterium]